MNKFKIELVSHKDICPDSVGEILTEFGNEILCGIETQIRNGRDPHVVFTRDEGDRSLLIYAGNREFAEHHGIAITDPDTAVYAIAMPGSCEMAQYLVDDLVHSENSITMMLDDIAAPGGPSPQLN